MFQVRGEAFVYKINEAHCNHLKGLKKTLLSTQQSWELRPSQLLDYRYPGLYFFPIIKAYQFDFFVQFLLLKIPSRKVIPRMVLLSFETQKNSNMIFQSVCV